VNSVPRMWPPGPFAGPLRAFPSLFLSVPNYLIGLLLIQVFAFQLGLFRVIEPDGGLATFFAAVTLGIPVSARIAEVLVAGFDHEGRQEYAAVARSRGLSQVRLLTAHLLKPSSLPVVTVLALAVGELLGNTLITETVFGRSGMGSLIRRSVTSQDLPVLQAVGSALATYHLSPVQKFFFGGEAVLDPFTGATVRSIEFTLQPNESVVATQFSLDGRDNASLRIEATGGDIWAFASIIDRGTLDPEYVPATPLP